MRDKTEATLAPSYSIVFLGTKHYLEEKKKSLLSHIHPSAHFPGSSQPD